MSHIFSNELCKLCIEYKANLIYINNKIDELKVIIHNILIFLDNYFIKKA